ncbi:hypothetical protein BDB00DRAFT_790608 [Zychaea mexicana]|uniref:uncharacterized protein n=1 Tax=Zychaea mexicana TaxID=64656 RepID=UPI0022FF0182|nr:uncharacterized protein BDB00DRAFT_790608 [Zychaea mexicana]KAI9490108.1 hypothetical protein BDB00DRAFT_790608 [Zychaea mexicana]
MWLNNSIFLLLLLHFLYCCQAINVVVDCTWPCADSTHACIVTDATVQCGPRHNSQWILPQPNGSPVFIGETARRNTPCVISPDPPLHETELDQVSNGRQSVIQWPPGNASNPLDAYLSDCELNTYCSQDTRICVQSIPEDATCESTHQCLNAMQCIENRCTDTSLDDNENIDRSHTSHVHIAIIVVVVVVAVLVIISAALFVYFYRKRKLKLNKKHNSSSSSSSPSVIALPTLSSPSAHHQQPPPAPPSLLVSPSQQQQQQQQQHNLHLHQSPQSHVPHQPSTSLAQPSTETTPYMQQQHLQYQLHRQHASIDINQNDASTSNNIPPPPYSP